MARDVRVKLSLKGLNALMRSQPLQAEVARAANRIKNDAGPGHTVTVNPHRWTARAYVDQSWAKARTDPDALDLLRAVASARTK